MQLTRLFIGATLLVAGCASTPEDPMSACRPPTCAALQSKYAAEVTSIGAGPPSIEFADIVLDPSGYFSLAIPTPANVFGQVTASGGSVPAAIIFTRPSRVLGRPDVFYQATVDSQGRYTVAVPPNVAGEQYFVRVQPSDAAHFPPLTMALTVEADKQIDIALPSGDAVLELHGKVTDVVGGAIGTARVTLRDAVSVLDVSSRATTDADGSFTLSVPTSVMTTSQSLVLSIERGDEQHGLVAMTVNLTPAEIEAQLVKQALALQLPSLQAASHLQLNVIGTGTNGVDQPIAGASVLLRTVLADGGILGATRAIHEISTVTDPNGQLMADVYSNDAGARTYTLTISPPSDSIFGTTTKTFTVGETSGFALTVKLDRRAVLSGQVLDPTGMALKGALLTPTTDETATVGVEAATVNVQAKLSSGATDTDGRFTFPLDSGTYTLGVVPPAMSALPRIWFPTGTITKDTDLGPIALPMAIEFDGIVVDQNTKPLVATDGTPIQSSVRLYLVPASNYTCDSASTDCLTAPKLQAESTTNKDGRASLLLSSN